MQIIVYLPDEEAYRDVETEDENIRASYREIVRAIENVAARHQIRYTGIEVVIKEGIK